MKNIFSFTDYKTYLMAIEERGEHKGFRSRVAESTGCQNAFVSQVLNGAVNFNLEQALRIADFLHLKDDEKQYLLWMVEFKRAATLELKKYFSALMLKLREKNLDIKNRIQISQILSSEAQSIYYSSWIYSAVHIAVMIPAMNSVKKLSTFLESSETTIQSTVDFLVANGLLERSGSLLKSGHTQIHLGRESGNINKHHSNWRIQCLKSLDTPQKSDLHYSGVSSLSIADVEKLRAQFVEIIENYVRTIEKSPEETVFTFNLDFFQVLKDFL